MNYIGVDPGVSGGYCIINEEFDSFGVHNFSTSLKPLISALQWECLVWIEHVHSSPNQGPKQAFSFGYNVGYWHGFLQAHGVARVKDIKEVIYTRAYECVSPFRWQRFFVNNFGDLGYIDRKAFLYEKAKLELDNEGITTKLTKRNADAILIALALKRNVSNSHKLEELHIS